MYNKIHVYDFNPRFKPKILSGNHPKDLTIGFEYEIRRKQSIKNLSGKQRYDSWGDYQTYTPTEKQKQFVTTFNKKCNKLVYWKFDASCDVEINSIPFNWNYYTKHQNKFDTTITNIIKLAKNTIGCGFHIHVNNGSINLYRLNDFLHIP